MYRAVLCSNNPTIAIPQKIHKPAKRPYNKPNVTSRPGVLFKNIPRFTAIINESKRVQPNIFPLFPFLTSSSLILFSRIHALPIRAGEYHTPPSTNEEIPATRIANQFNVFINYFLFFKESNVFSIFRDWKSKGIKPEKKGMNKIATKNLQLNDIGFRLVLIPSFGIAIPLLTNMIKPSDFNHWEFKLAYGYTILLAFIIWQGNRYLLFSLRSYFNWFNKPIRKIIALLVAVSFFTIPISSVMLIGWYHLFKKGLVNWQVVNTSTLIILICVLFITHVYETVFLVKESESEMLKNEQLERAKAEAELQALKNQIDPHFMFNSLNTLSYLIDESTAKAKEFNDHLADIYRYILQNKSGNLVMVREEIIFLQDYFSLQEIRYGNAVTLQTVMPTELQEQFMMPPISLQMLAENAFKHNDFSVHDPLQLKVFFNNQRIIVYNKIRKKDLQKQSSKIGLLNLQERYKLTTGMTIEITETNTEFIVSLPIIKID